MVAYKTLEVTFDNHRRLLENQLSMKRFKIDKPRKNFVNDNIKKITKTHPLNQEAKPLAIDRPSKMRNVLTEYGLHMEHPNATTVIQKKAVYRKPLFKTTQLRDSQLNLVTDLISQREKSALGLTELINS